MSNNKSDIGLHINVYHGYRIRNIEFFTTLLLLFVLFVIPFFVGLYRTIYGYAQYGPVPAFSWGFPWLVFSFVCFLLISIYFIYRLNIARVFIHLHTHGILIQKLLRKERTFRWEDISELYVIQQQLRSNSKSHSTKAVIYTMDNVRLSFRDSMIENLPELLTQIKASVYIHQYPKIRERFHMGKVMSFGPINVQSRYIKINQAGIKRQSPQIHYAEINRITVKSGQLLIKLKTNIVYRINTATVPNIEILLDLISINT